MTSKNSKKVLVAMSGGVDSSVAAALLKKQGYAVTGGYMKNFSQERWSGILKKNCPWENDLRDVKRVSRVLKIPYICFNFEKEYEKKVIDYFFSDYKAGRTPNPDIMCNKEIKFKIFLEKAKKLGFDYIATGHYVRKFPLTTYFFPRRLSKNRESIQFCHSCESRNPVNLLFSVFSGFPIRSGMTVVRQYPWRKGLKEKEFYKLKAKSYRLFKGVDAKKDQSYFLYALTQKQLRYCLFPVGGYAKAEVRELAKKFKLPNAEKKDSQGICFIGHVKLHDFLQQRIPEKKGKIIDTKGNIVGEHKGVWYYTIGQRHGIGLGGGAPYYVLRKDIKKNQLIVTRRKSKEIFKKTLSLKNIHWIAEEPKLPFHCTAKIRYQQPDQGCILKKDGRGFMVEFSKPQFAIAEGQSIVFYKKDIMLGGGIIERDKKKEGGIVHLPCLSRSSDYSRKS